MEAPTKTLELKTIYGSKMVVTYATVVSEWDLQEIEKIYLDRMTINEEGKAVVDKDQTKGLVADRENAVLNHVIKKIEVDGAEEKKEAHAKTLKKALDRKEFTRLMDVIIPIVEPVSDEKKNHSPKDSSSA